jgi:two-component system sensor histidine kinase KdpD
MSESSPAHIPDSPTTRGKLKVFLGYAAGVGKTYQMLVEAHQLKAEGLDIVIGYFEPHGRKDTIAKAEGLESIPRRIVEHRGTRLEEMDTGAILLRHPQVCVVDEFAHTNAPGSERKKRWEDVMVLRAAGIDVLTSLNVQHIESLNDQVWQVTGIRVRETIPDWAVQEADEVVMVDVTPRALLHRLERGVVYAPDKAQRALDNFFTESNLTALRELALRQTAHQIEERRDEEQVRSPSPVVPDPGSVRPERILLWLTAHPTTAMLIRRGRRVADYLQSACMAVAVVDHCSADERGAIERHLNFARNMRIETSTIGGRNPAEAIADYARGNQITQVFVTRHVPDLHKFVRLVRDMQVTIVSERTR